MPISLPRPRMPSLGSRRPLQRSLTPDSPSIRPRPTYATKSLPFSFRSKPRTYKPQRYPLSLSSSPRSTTTSLPATRAPSRVPSSNIDNTNDEAQLADFVAPMRTYTESTKSSSQSSAPKTTTIIIDPSHSLRAMQSVGSDTSPTDSNCTWRTSDRYLNHSQLSIAGPEVYKPTGSPAWLVEELNLRPPVRKPSLQVTNGASTDWDEPIYGPSAEDLADLIERERQWDEEQQRPKPWRPLRRFASLKKDLAGGIKRTISLGKKKGFEPRAQPVRTQSEKQVERPRGVMRANTIGAAYVRRWSIRRQRGGEEGCEG